MSIIQFQFSDSCTTNWTVEHWSRKLQDKLHEHPTKDRSKYVFIASKRITQYKIVYDENFQFKKLVFIKESKKHEKFPADITDLLFDEKRHEVAFFRVNQKLCIWNPKIGYKSKPNIEFATVFCWYIDKQNNKKYLIVAPKYTGKIEIWDWDNRRCIHMFESYKRSTIQLIVNEEASELLTLGVDGAFYNGVIKLWCLKTFALLKTFENDSDKIRNLCFIDSEKTLFVGTCCDRKANSFGSYDKTRFFKIWNKETGKCICKQKIDFVNYELDHVVCSPKLKLLIASHNKNLYVFNIVGSNDNIELKLYYTMCIKDGFYNNPTQFLNQSILVLLHSSENKLCFVDLVEAQMHQVEMSQSDNVKYGGTAFLIQ